MRKLFEILNVKYTIIIWVIASVLLAVLLTLYNINFKYDKNDAFFKALDKRSKELNDEFVSQRLSFALEKLNYTILNYSKKITILDISTTPNIDLANIIESAYQNGNVKICGYKNDGCFAKEYKNLLGESYVNPQNFALYKFKTSDGFSISYNITDRNCNKAFSGYKNYCGQGFIDVNGPKQPNIFGVDLFDIGVYANKNAQPIFSCLYDPQESFETCRKGFGTACTAFPRFFKQRKYLKKNVSPKKSSFLKKNPRIRKSIYLPLNGGRPVFFDRYGFRDFVTPEKLIKHIKRTTKYKITSNLKDSQAIMRLQLFKLEIFWENLKYYLGIK